RNEGMREVLAHPFFHGLSLLRSLGRQCQNSSPGENLRHMSGEASLRQIHQVEPQQRRSGETTSFCRESSAAAGEVLAGTAVDDVDNWLLVEDASAWGSDALNENGLPETVAAKVRALGKR